MRSGSLTRPRPLEAFDCGSQSMSRVFTSAAAKDEARLMAVVVLPTPPFWLATAMTRPIGFLGDREQPQNNPNHSAIAMTDLCKEMTGPFCSRFCTTFHVEHIVDLHKRSTWNVSAILHCVPRGTLSAFCKST